MFGGDHSAVRLDREKGRPTTANVISDRTAVCSRGKNSITSVLDLPQVGCQSRQICDVLGPEACYECRQIIGRNDNNNYVCDEKYPNMHLTEENFTAAVLAMHTMPHLTTFDVQQDVARGKISTHTGFREQAERIRSAGFIRAKGFPRPMTAVVKSQPSRFFTDINDLNKKLTIGPGERNNKYIKDIEKLKEQYGNSEKVMSKYISPRIPKEEFHKKERFILNLEPPLLPKVCQNVETAFFVNK